MIISRTPFRMSFLGGGTDLPDFFYEHGGKVISTTFDKYCYVTVRKLPSFFEYKTHLTYSIEEKVNSIEEIKHPLIKNAMAFTNVNDLRIVYDSDLPARSGLGTSSSFAVGLLNAFYSLKEKATTKQKLADNAIYLERTLCNEAGGLQDQIAASFGGFNTIEFSKKGYTVTPLKINPKKKEQLNKNLMLFFTGFQRNSSAIQSKTKVDMQSKTTELLKMYELVDRGEKILLSEDSILDDFGSLLDYSWNLKKSISKSISLSEIDEQYEKAINAGAIGGKLLGAGGGGFLLFYVPESKQTAVKEALKNLLYVPFYFEDEGSQIIFNNEKE